MDLRLSTTRTGDPTGVARAVYQEVEHLALPNVNCEFIRRVVYQVTPITLAISRMQGFLRGSARNTTHGIRAARRCHALWGVPLYRDRAPCLPLRTAIALRLYRPRYTPTLVSHCARTLPRATNEAVLVSHSAQEVERQSVGRTEDPFISHWRMRR